MSDRPPLPPDYYKGIIRNLEKRIAQLEAERDELQQQLAAGDEQALDMPDGPGWWAFDGVSTAIDEPIRECYYLVWENDILVLPSRLGSFRIEHLVGKWYRLTMPWERRKEQEAQRGE